MSFLTLFAINVVVSVVVVLTIHVTKFLVLYKTGKLDEYLNKKYGKN